jgi:hypothetical protein
MSYSFLYETFACNLAQGEHALSFGQNGVDVETLSKLSLAFQLTRAWAWALRRHEYAEMYRRQLKTHLQSFLTREREEDSNATPPNTTSFVCPPVPETGSVDTGGTMGVGVVIVIVLGIVVVVVVEAGFEGPATFKPGRIYLLAGL